MHSIRTRLFVFMVTLLLSACSVLPPSDGPPTGSELRDSGSIPNDAVPHREPRSKYGNPKSYVVFGKRYYVLASNRGYEEQGVASWYGKKFHGRRTSSGETYDMYAMSAAHKTLPLPTYLQVTNLENGRQVVVRVNDRGPFHDNRIIDLSYSAARKLGILKNGTGLVRIRAIQPGEASGQGVTRLAQKPTRELLGKLRIYLQVGAYSLRDNALRVKTRLTSITTDTVFIQKVVTGAREIFRVRLGPLRSVEEADQLSSKMLDLNMDLPRIVIE